VKRLSNAISRKGAELILKPQRKSSKGGGAKNKIVDGDLAEHYNHLHSLPVFISDEQDY